MVKQSSPVQQQLAQLEYLENSQLKQLLVELEAQKRLLPDDDHAIIDWGINTLKAKILNREALMEENWEEFYNITYEDFLVRRPKISVPKYEALSRGYTLLNLASMARSKERQDILYAVCCIYLIEIANTASLWPRDDMFRASVKLFKLHLNRFLIDIGEGERYQDVIDDMVHSFEDGCQGSYGHIYSSLVGFLKFS